MCYVAFPQIFLIRSATSIFSEVLQNSLGHLKNVFDTGVMGAEEFIFMLFLAGCSTSIGDDFQNQQLLKNISGWGLNGSGMAQAGGWSSIERALNDFTCLMCCFMSWGIMQTNEFGVGILNRQSVMQNGLLGNMLDRSPILLPILRFAVEPRRRRQRNYKLCVWILRFAVETRRRTSATTNFVFGLADAQQPSA